MALGDQQTANRLVETIRRQVQYEIKQKGIQVRTGTVTEINRDNATCRVSFEGSTAVLVKMGSIQPQELGQLVRVQGTNDDSWIVDVIGRAALTGPPSTDLGVAAVFSLTTTGRAVTATWSFDSLAAQYELQMASDVGFTIGSASFLTVSNGITISSLIEGDEHWFRVRSVSSSGQVGTWSSVENIVVQGFPAVASDGSAPSSSPTPSIDPGLGTLDVRWARIPNNDEVNYAVHASVNSGFTPDANNKVGDTTGTFMSLSVLPDGTRLPRDNPTFVRIVASDTDGVAAVSPQGSGTPDSLDSDDFGDVGINEISDGQPPSVSPASFIITPSIGSFFLRWAGVTNADPVDYEVHLSTTPGFLPTANTLALTTRSTFAYVRELPVGLSGGPLQYGVVYHMRIHATDADGASTNPSPTQSGVILKITTPDLTDGLITPDFIAPGAVTRPAIGPDAVGATEIENASIGSAQIGNAAITSAKIGEAQILTAHIGLAQIGAAHIQVAAIGTAHIGEAVIGSAQIANAAIDNAKIRNAAIDSAKIQDASIGSAQIADAAIGSAQIADAAITNAKIATLTADKITAGELTGVTITGNLVRSAALGARAEIQTGPDSGNIKFFSGDVAETLPGVVFSGSGVNPNKSNEASGFWTAKPPRLHASGDPPTLELWHSKVDGESEFRVIADSIRLAGDITQGLSLLNQQITTGGGLINTGGGGISTVGGAISSTTGQITTTSGNIITSTGDGDFGGTLRSRGTFTAEGTINMLSTTARISASGSNVGIRMDVGGGSVRMQVAQLITQIFYSTGVAEFACQSNGDIAVWHAGVSVWNAGVTISDERFKKDIIPAPMKALDMVRQIDFVEYEFDDSSVGGLYLPPGRRLGVKAGQVQSVIPYAVNDENGTRLMDPLVVALLALGAVKDLDETVALLAP